MRRVRHHWLIVVPGLALVGVLGAEASRLDDFNRARNAYAFGNYREAIRLLKGLLQPLRLRDQDRIVEARQILGVSSYFVKDYKGAREQFERLLYLRPRHRLDPLLIPPPVIEFFEKVRARIRDKLERLHPETKPPVAGPRVLLRRVQQNHLILNFVPFGVGQFQNRRSGKAVFFLTAQVATLAANLITYVAAESLRRPDGRFLEADLGLARNLRIAQVVSLSAFGALVVWGIIDALVEYRPQVLLEERTLAPVAPASRRRSSRGSFRLQLGPWISAQGGGLGLRLKF